MTSKQLIDVLTASGVPFAYSHFHSPQVAPYGVVVSPGTDNFDADNRVYHEITQWRIELYTKGRDFALEDTIKSIISTKGIVWEITNAVFIPEEDIHMTVFEFEL